MIDKNNAVDDEEDEENDLKTSSKANKKKILLIILPILIVIGLVVSFYAVFNTKKEDEKKNYQVIETAAEGETTATGNTTLLYDLPAIDVLLNSNNNQQARAKIQITIETKNIEADKTHLIEAFIPRINDSIITHLIELHPEEIQSSEGIYWLKEELLHRINLITHPILISNLNFKSFEIQKQTLRNTKVAEEKQEKPDIKETASEKKEDWADMIKVQDEAGSNNSSTESSKLLNQEEIYSLFGHQSTEGQKKSIEESGVKAILNSSMVSYERLPMLDVVFDRLIRMMATSLRNFTQDNVEVSLESIESMRFGEYIDSLTLPTLLSVFRAEEWDNYGLISVDSSLVYSIVDVLLGGRRGTAAMRIEGRPYTTIELNLVKDMIDLVLADLSTAFDPITTVNFNYDRTETNPRFAAIARMSNAVIVARLHIDMEDRGGKLDMMIPYATLEPVRDLLLQMFMGERYGRDTIWENHLVEELWETEVEIDACLKEMQIDLKEIAKWKKGSFLNLDMDKNSNITLICGDIPLLSGTMGRKADKIAIRVKGKAEKNG